jgi:16S rRNA (guanine1207-N2)-methyltransferase
MVQNHGIEHYYSEKQKSSLRLRKIKAVLRGISFEFYTGSGVFSKNKVDKGTALLANNMLINKDDKVLDIGCGIGILGIVAAKCFPETSVSLADVNRRALSLAKMNIELNNLFNADVFYSDLYKNIKDKFNTILVNPPQTAGKQICFEIIEKSKDYLEKNGLLQLVARHNKGGRQLSEKMKNDFGNLKEIAKKGGYRIYVSKKN